MKTDCFVKNLIYFAIREINAKTALQGFISL